MKLSPLKIEVNAFTGFHPSVADWFRSRLGEPTPVQEKAWKAIREGAHTLIAAPTGSGKTLAAFLTILNDLIVRGWNEALPRETTVLYVSPLKALSNDVEKNLSGPLREIEDSIFNLYLKKINIHVAVRTGDTPPAARAAMLKSHPHILITTPESLFLLLTSKHGRNMLSKVKTVIVDEIHAMVGEKRGAHLALSLERLQALVSDARDGSDMLVRIGLSATQKPIEEVARFLTGVGLDGVCPPCRIIDTGHRRCMDLQLEIPASPLTAVMANEVWEEVYTRIESLIQQHQTTLVFVNTRRLAERVAHRLSQSLGEDKVAAHHGSLSRERRFSAEQRLKSGSLQALVATASLELGIDIGSVDLVIQIACPKSISALLQRVGRSGHAVGGLPKGRLFPLTRDELVEAAALMDAVRRGELDTLVIPEKPLDILAQQIVAETACREWGGEKLFQLFRRAYPFRNLTHPEFQEITEMLSMGFTTRRGRRGSHLHHDGIHDRLRGRPGARLTALTNGGAIPDTFDYDVKLEPGNTLLGSVNEDFAIDSVPGDIFQLGNNSWQILRIEGGTVRVSDAHGQPPSIPFWLGEAPGRTEAFSIAVSRIREDISTRLGDKATLQHSLDLDGSSPGAPWRHNALQWLTEEVGILSDAAEQLIDYLASAKLALGVMPSRETLVLERFFDDAGDMHMILHSPFGSRMNRAWGLSLRKRFCRKFNFELQAAATEEGIILSLGATHSFPLEEVFQYLRSGSVRHILIQALLDAPMFEVRWRWNATRALALQRNRNGKKVPPQLQRMAAEDLVALVFPDQKACFENIQGERAVPDHPLVRQTIEDCLHEAMDIEGLEKLLANIEAGKLRLEARDLKEPSPLSQEIISARPYAFLDDAPLEERRTRAIQSRRYLDPVDAGELGRLDPQAIATVRSEAWPQARNPDELHDALMLTGFLTEDEMTQGVGWRVFLQTLMEEGRVAALIPKARENQKPIWVAAERLDQALRAFPASQFAFEPSFKMKTPAPPEDSLEAALVELVRGRMESLGPIRNVEIAASLGLTEGEADQALYALEQEGFILRGHFTPEAEGLEWCERRLLARIHRYSLAKLRREIEPVSTSDYLRFLFSWQGLNVTANPQPKGPESLEAILESLEGFEAPCAAWESEILPARMSGYEPAWLDLQGLTGNFIWCRLRPQLQPQRLENRKPGPMKATPIAFIIRENLDLWLANGSAPDSTSTHPKSTNLSQSTTLPDSKTLTEPEGDATRVLDYLKKSGASFWRDIVWETGLSTTQTKEAIAELVAIGCLTSDGFRGLRTLLHSQSSSTHASAATLGNMEKSGRWSYLNRSRSNPVTGESQPFATRLRGNLLSQVEKPARPSQHRHTESSGLESLARVLLKRYGVVFRKLADRENGMPPWRDLIRSFRTLEARGEIRGGRFVEGVYGEQFALPEALPGLRAVRKQVKQGKLLSISAADPANLQGILTTGPRIPATRKNRILFQDGEPVAALEGGIFRLLPGLSINPVVFPEPSRIEAQAAEWERALKGEERTLKGNISFKAPLVNTDSHSLRTAS